MKNLIIAGIGGQGVNVLTKVLGEVCLDAGLGCQYTVHKGGAQSLGTVYGEMRIAEGKLPVLGAGIPKGRLDYLVALDPWEALRHLPLAHAQTSVWVETEVQPVFNERRATGADRHTRKDPAGQLASLPLSLTWRHYRRDAQAGHGSVAMANYLAGLDCMTALDLGDIGTYERIFFETIRPAAAREKA